MSDNTPDDTLLITRDGKPTELLMSFGLLNELLVIVGDMTNIPLIAGSHDLRQTVLTSVLSPRDEKGLIAEPVFMFNLKVSAADVQRICKWVGEHCLDFFIETIENSVRTHQDQLPRLRGAVHSTLSGTGSKG